MSELTGNSELATLATTILASLLGGTASGAAEAIGNQVYSEISRRLRRSSSSAAVFSAFEANPGSVEAKRMLKEQLVGEFAKDEAFGRQIRTLIGQDRSQNLTKVSAGGSGVAVGRDYNKTTNTRKTNNHYGGILIAAVAVVVIGLVLLLGRGAVNILQTFAANSATGGLSGKSTCKQFLAAEPSAQQAIMKKLYLERNKMERAGDPFLLQNAQYSCGFDDRADTTLAQMADQAK